MSDDDLPSIVPGLAALAGADAVEGLERHVPFVVTIDDVAIRVEFTWGTTPTVFLSTPYAPRLRQATGAGPYREVAAPPIAARRPLAIRLALETDDDRDAKRRGVARELQTGDAAFDGEVYVDSPSDDLVVGAVFARADVRDACRLLLADGFIEIDVDDEHGEIRTRRGLCAHARADASTVARAFAAIASGVPPVDKAGHRRTSNVLFGVTSALGLVAAPVIIAIALAAGPFLLTLFGVFVGGTTGVWFGRFPARALRGRSDSHWRGRAVVSSFGAVGTMCGALWTLAASGHRAAMVVAVACAGAAVGSILLAAVEGRRRH